MIKIYGMHTCPDCTFVEAQVEGNNEFKVIEIGEHVRNLKEFLRIRDQHPAFDATKRQGSIGIPCFVREDGSVTLVPEEVGLKSRDSFQGAACSIDGKGC